MTEPPLAARVYCALLHYPVKDRAGETVTTAVTTLDVHDIARSARTYGMSGYYVVTPIEAQHRLVERVLSHWRTGAGRKRMPERHEALARVRTVESWEAALADVEREMGQPPRVVVTAARPTVERPTTPFAELRAELQRTSGSYVILFGTGHGLTDDVLRRADVLLAPIRGAGDYNHLSVRSAAAIVFDRLLH